MIDGIQLAKIFGPVFVILGLWEILLPHSALTYAKSIKDSPTFLTLGGFINLVLGFTVITYYNVWDWNLGLLVTLLGWVAVLKGILIFFYPGYTTKFKFNTQKVLLGGIFILLWGAGLCYWGYLL